MEAICRDLAAEHSSLDAIVAELDEQGWNTVTPFDNWSIKDEISHLTYFDEAARLSVTDADAFNKLLEEMMANFKGFDEEHERVNSIGRNMTGVELLAWWRKERSLLVDAYASVDPKTRLPWFGPPMSARSSATARLMETWAHGQDIVDALEISREPADRLKNIAHLGVSTFSWSYANRGLPVPEMPVRVELTGPSGDLWAWGPEDAENRVAGTALDFCLVVSQRRHVAVTAIAATGDIATDWMVKAQIFAGPLKTGRHPASDNRYRKQEVEHIYKGEPDMKTDSGQASYDRYFTREHDMLRKAIRELVKKEILPHIEEWEEAGEFPRELYKASADLGYSGIGFPEELGGTPGDVFHAIVVAEELMRSGSAGLVASLGSYGIALPPIVGHGTPEQKEKYVKPVLAGERIAALAITEPGGGSDVANMKTTAEKDGGHYVVNGSKTFITSGVRADQITCAVRTGGEGAHGISFLVIETDTPGFAVGKKLDKMGWWASDTAELYFDNCRVPVENLVGEENKGFYIIMENFQMERLQLAVMANMTAQLALEEATRYAKEREAFGRPLKGFQVTRHKLVDMATLVEVSREFTYRVAAKINAGENQTKEISMAKNFACKVSDRVTFDAVQIFGGYGFMRGYLVERLYRDNRILSIGGGTQEIMKEIIWNFI